MFSMKAHETCVSIICRHCLDNQEITLPSNTTINRVFGVAPEASYVVLRDIEISAVSANAVLNPASKIQSKPLSFGQRTTEVARLS
jgi:hypothetical protein